MAVKVLARHVYDKIVQDFESVIAEHFADDPAADVKFLVAMQTHFKKRLVASELPTPLITLTKTCKGYTFTFSLDPEADDALDKCFTEEI